MGKLANVDCEVRRLLGTHSDDGAFLIITVEGTEDFLQLVGDARGVQLDFPLVTGRQMSFEAAFKAVAQGEGLSVVENSDGSSRFLDIHLNSDVHEVSRITKVFLQGVFRVNDHTELLFECEDDEWVFND